MARLILSKDGEVLRDIPIPHERLSIGRRPGNALRIDDPRISQMHAVIVTSGKSSYIEDLGSTNGTLVNGEPIAKHLLQDRDVVTVGDHQLSYIAREGAGSGTDCCDTLVAPGRRTQPPASGPAPKAVGSAASPAASWKNPKTLLAVALLTLALTIWAGRFYESYRADEELPAERQAARIVECRKLYSRVEAQTMSPEKAHDATLAAFKQGACKD